MRVLMAVLVAAALASSGCERSHGVAGAAPAALSRRRARPSATACVSSPRTSRTMSRARDRRRGGVTSPRAPRSSWPPTGNWYSPTATSAARGIDDLTRTIKSIELRWGDDLRVDPLTPDLAVMASSWSELRVAADGGRVTDRGYFTRGGTARRPVEIPQCPLVGGGTGAEGTVSLRERPSAGGARAGSCRMRREHCSIGSQVIPPK